MNVQSYLFQSPSPQQVQVGRLDASTIKEETESKTTSDDTVKSTQIIEEVQTQNTQNPLETNPNHILDIYV
ncbi:MAG: hypothetical protein ACI9TV_000773 [Sulfurimonas sp.]|jgi:hypothetical protein|uniref:hypothetical protein n=1 Tax=Sulfurimonas sp. TaxID=2022749 RepID=UPI0039E2D8EE